MNKKRIAISSKDFLDLMHKDEITIFHNSSTYNLVKVKKAYNGQIEVHCKCLNGNNELDDQMIVYNNNFMECDND